MGGKALIVLAIAWLTAVGLWVLLGPQAFSYAWHAKGNHRTAILFTLVSISVILYQVFLFGWVVPLVMGIFRIIRKH